MRTAWLEAGALAAKHGGGTNWLPWFLFLAAAGTAGVLYLRMAYYRSQVQAEESMTAADVEALHRRLDHLAGRDSNDYWILCYRLARGSARGQIALAREVEGLEAERHRDPEDGAPQPR